MDIDMNLVLPVTVGSFAGCLCLAWIAIEIGKCRAKRKLEEDRKQFIAQATAAQAQLVLGP